MGVLVLQFQGQHKVPHDFDLCGALHSDNIRRCMVQGWMPSGRSLFSQTAKMKTTVARQSNPRPIFVPEMQAEMQ